jgi:hypothetical protein
MRDRSSSPRISFSPSLLIVGCESTAQSWGAHKVVGVDLDDVLIRLAWRKRRTVWSLQAPTSDETPVSDGFFDGLDGSKKRKRESESESSDVVRSAVVSRPDYFPASFEHTFGPLPIPPRQTRGQHVFPHNLTFRTADWVENEIPEDADGYDVVIA